MTPTLTDGELICCAKASDFAPDDIITFHYNNKILVKRVIGQPRDWIDISEEGTEQIVGKIFVRLWSLNRLGAVK